MSPSVTLPWTNHGLATQLCLPRITEQGLVQAALLEQLGWQLPERISP